MCEKFFYDKKVRGSGEGMVEGEDRTGTFEAVSGKVEFGHCMDWVHMRLALIVRGIFRIR